MTTLHNVFEFLVELKRLALLVEELLPERWMACAFVSRLPQVRELLQALARMDAMTLDQILIWAQVVMIDDKKNQRGWSPDPLKFMMMLMHLRQNHLL